MEQLLPRIFIPAAETDTLQLEGGITRTLLAYDADTMLAKVVFNKGSIGTIHSHPHVQLTYIESGSFEVAIGDQKSILNAGSSFYVPSGIAHGVLCLEAGILIDVFSPMRKDFL